MLLNTGLIPWWRTFGGCQLAGTKNYGTITNRKFLILIMCLSIPWPPTCIWQQRFIIKQKAVYCGAREKANVDQQPNIDLWDLPWDVLRREQKIIWRLKQSYLNQRAIKNKIKTNIMLHSLKESIFSTGSCLHRKLGLFCGKCSHCVCVSHFSQIIPKQLTKSKNFFKNSFSQLAPCGK